MRIFCAVIFLTGCQATNSYADSVDIFCPSVQEIRQGDYHRWLPLYQEGEELVMPSDMTRIQEHVQSFVGAKWDTLYLETAHCFYSGDDEILGQIVFARDAWQPLSVISWRWVTDKFAQCHSLDPRECGFIADGVRER